MSYRAHPPQLGVDWRPEITTRIKAYDSTLTRLACSSNGVNIAGEITLGSATGTGTVLPSTIEGGGVRISSGATAGGTRVANLGAAATVPTQITNSRTIHWAAYVRADIVTAVASGAEIAIMCGVQDGTNDNYLGQDAAVSTTNWVLSVGASGADTGVAFDTSIHDLLLRNDGTNVYAYVDWVLVGTAASTGVATAAGWTRAYAFNAAVNGTVNFDINRWALFTTDP